jgi:flagellar motor switch protein FliM
MIAEIQRVDAQGIRMHVGMENNPKWAALQHVPVRLVVKLPLPPMSLRKLHQLRVGMVIESKWSAGEEVPLWSSDVTLSWCEFAVVNDKIAARLTRLG